jgi:hypothetical protein
MPNSLKTPTLPNLDACTDDELARFYQRHASGGHAKDLFDQPEMKAADLRNVTHSLAGYAANLMIARKHRLAGTITEAQRYERACEGIYRLLPAWARW